MCVCGVYLHLVKQALLFVAVFLMWSCSFLQKAPKAGESPTRAILKGWVGADDEFTSLWAGLGQALSVVEGVVGGTEPDRFGALLRGYLVYLHLTNESWDHYTGNIRHEGTRVCGCVF